MKINRLELENFRSFDKAELQLDGKSTVIFGVNGTGKTSVLKSINLLYASIINQIVNRKELKQNFNVELDDIKYGKTQTKIEADFIMENQLITYNRTMVRKTGKRGHDLENLKNIAALFQEKYIDDEKQDNIPIFVNYGTNRLVLDIPMRIRNKHTFDIYSAFDKAIENRIDFRTFFECDFFLNQIYTSFFKRSCFFMFFAQNIFLWLYVCILLKNYCFFVAIKK